MLHIATYYPKEVIIVAISVSCTETCALLPILHGAEMGLRGLRPRRPTLRRPIDRTHLLPLSCGPFDVYMWRSLSSAPGAARP